MRKARANGKAKIRSLWKHLTCSRRLSSAQHSSFRSWKTNSWKRVFKVLPRLWIMLDRVFAQDGRVCIQARRIDYPPWPDIAGSRSRLLIINHYVIRASISNSTSRTIRMQACQGGHRIFARPPLREFGRVHACVRSFRIRDDLSNHFARIPRLTPLAQTYRNVGDHDKVPAGSFHIGTGP